MVDFAEHAAGRTLYDLLNNVLSSGDILRTCTAARASRIRNERPSKPCLDGPQTGVYFDWGTVAEAFVWSCARADEAKFLPDSISDDRPLAA